MQRPSAARQNHNGEITPPHTRIRYSSAWVSAASALPCGVFAIRPWPLVRLLTAAVRRPRRFAALLALLRRTPRVYVMLSGSAAGRALDEYFHERSLGLVPMTRFCRGVLPVPCDHADYLRGRRRQALRTNLRRAQAAGIQCEVVNDPWRSVDDVTQVLLRHHRSLPAAELDAHVNDINALVGRPETTLAVARDEQGRPLAMAAAVIDDTVCLIKHAVATSHDARWALHDYIVRMLIARRVRYLVATGGGAFGALGFPSNVQHYQHLLGYELRHVIPLDTHRLTLRRRLFASRLLGRSASLQRR